MERIKIIELLNSKEEQESILVKGWVRTRRDSKGGFSFLEINDGSCMGNIQSIVDHSLNEFQVLDKQITTGSCVAITGNLVASEGKGQNMEVQARSVKVYGTADAEA